MRIVACGNNWKAPWDSHFGVDQETWGSIATYVCELSPEITARCKWHNNEGDGLNGEDSISLAGLLKKEIEGGGAMNYAVEVLDPYELCYDCAPAGSAGDPTCNRCSGEGLVPSAEKREFFVSWLRTLAGFLRGCGGFQFVPQSQHDSQHEEDLRALQWYWEASCDSAREEFQRTLQRRCVSRST